MPIGGESEATGGTSPLVALGHAPGVLPLHLGLAFRAGVVGASAGVGAGATHSLTAGFESGVLFGELVAVNAVRLSPVHSSRPKAKVRVRTPSHRPQMIGSDASPMRAGRSAITCPGFHGPGVALMVQRLHRRTVRGLVGPAVRADRPPQAGDPELAVSLPEWRLPEPALPGLVDLAPEPLADFHERNLSCQ